ncbi:MAG: ABC transporter permease [Bacteroidota bacterium]
MRTIGYILQKEFRQVFRNKAMLPIIFMLPIVQLIIIVNAATFEIKNSRLFVVDLDRSVVSRELISHFSGSPFFKITGYSASLSAGEESMQQGKADAILQLPQNLEKEILSGQRIHVQLVVNAINGTTGGLTNAYAQSAIQQFSRDLQQANANVEVSARAIEVPYSFWYNPELNYKAFMVPGILAILVTVVSLILSAMNVVREKEIGTIEQINVTPIRKSQFIIGKLLPFMFIALFELAFGLTVGKLLFGIPMVGSLWLIFLSAAVYIFGILGIGLLVSTVSNTQQQAMFVSFFFMIIFILMSGLFTAAENMPVWAQEINRANPVAYFIRIMRMVLLKGSGFRDVRHELGSLLVIGISVFSLAVWRYRKTN